MMNTIILTKTNSDGQSTEYKNQETGETITISAGKAAWTWTGKTTSPLLKKLFNKILNAYIEKGIAQHDYVGGFEEATSKLEITFN